MKRNAHIYSKCISLDLNLSKQGWTRLFMLSDTNSEKTIQNANLPSCKDCIFHRPSKNSVYVSSLSNCAKFGEKNILTGKIEYDYISNARKDETKCGLIGRHFELEPNLQFKIVRHNIFNNIWFVFPIVIIILNIALITSGRTR
jgi:hypothetical protein